MNNLLKNSCELGIYKNYVSLGHCCHVASDLERLGLRNCSLPFDWIISEWKTVDNILSKKVDTFIVRENLYQNETLRSNYKSEVDGVIFIHDFTSHKTFRSQFKNVYKKYQKRIERLYTIICEPTLFFRFCSTESEFEYILNNCEDISAVLTKYNKKNRLVVISDYKLQNEFFVDCIDVFYINSVNDTNDLHPIINCPELLNILISAKLDNKENNLAFLKHKKLRTYKKTFIKKLKRKLEKIHKKYFRKDYLHNKTYQ